MILIIDNYDSFTYNLVQRLGELDAGPVRVVRNDVAPPAELEASEKPDRLIISPGPGTPDDAGLSCDYIRHFHGKIPILGVCLGHQCIGQVFGGTVKRAGRLMHGKVSQIAHDGQGVLAGVDNPFTATRYHSLIVDAAGMGDEWVKTAWTVDQDELMGLRCTTAPTEGVQFHPESFLTEAGFAMLANFAKL